MKGQRKNFIYSFILFSLMSFSQKREIKKIDSLLELSEKYAWTDRMEALKFAKKANVIAERIHNSEKKAYTYLYIGKALSFLGLTSQSFYYIEKASRENFTSGDIILQALIKQENSANFGKIGLDSQVLKENLSIIKLLKSIESPMAARIRLRAYGNISAYYMNTGDFKTALKFMKIAEYYSKDILLANTEHIKGAISNLETNKGYIYLHLFKNRDSALFYFKKSLSTVISDSSESKSTPYRALSEFYEQQKEYDQALKYSLLSAEDLESRKLDITDYKTSLYFKIAELYKRLGQTDKQKEYLDKYNKENEKTVLRNPASLRKAVEVILNTEKTIKEDEYQKLTIISGFIIMIVILISILIYRIKSGQTQHIINEKDQRLREKRDIISNKEQEARSLSDKLNGAAKELIDLAKSNNPIFYKRFIEIYPDFQSRILAANSNMSNSEFILLAYIFLNIDTKDIADMSYKSVRTVQNRKYRLRKKLGLSTHQDFYVWIKEFLKY